MASVTLASIRGGVPALIYRNTAARAAMAHLLLYAPRGSVRGAILLGKDGAAFNRQALAATTAPPAIRSEWMDADG